MKTKITFKNQPPAIVAWGLHKMPAGPLVVGVTPDGAVCRISFARGKAADVVKQWEKEWPQTAFIKDEKETATAARAIAKTNTAPALHMVGTEFQQKVWKGLLAIPVGETVSYGTLARRIKNPKAARAVGSACGANPVLLVVPCHRVIANDGGLGGFSSGLDLKKALLKSEAKPKKKARA